MDRPRPARAAAADQVLGKVPERDIDARNVLRADVTAEDVTQEGFDMVFRTWGDTKVARIRISWTALGELKDADAWEVG